MIHDVVQFHTVSARWGPRQLTLELKQGHIDACQELGFPFKVDSGGFLSRIDTGDKTSFDYRQLEKKRAKNEWRHSSSLKSKKFCTKPSAGKFVLTLFWDDRGVFLEHYRTRGNIVISTHIQISGIIFDPQSNPNDMNFYVKS